MELCGGKQWVYIGVYRGLLKVYGIIGLTGQIPISQNWGPWGK